MYQLIHANKHAHIHAYMHTCTNTYEIERERERERARERERERERERKRERERARASEQACLLGLNLAAAVGQSQRLASSRKSQGQSGGFSFLRSVHLIFGIPPIIVKSNFTQRN